MLFSSQGNDKILTCLESEEMTGFFNRSLTGIRTLVGNQCKEVEEETGRPPKVVYKYPLGSETKVQMN